MTEELVRAAELGVQRHHVLSRRLRERRRSLGLTQKEVVARLRRLGVTTTNKALSSLEHGAGLDVAKLPELAGALECTLTYLVGLTEDPHSWCPDPGRWPDPPARPAGQNGAQRNGAQNGTGQNGTGQNGTGRAGRQRGAPAPPILGPLHPH